MATKKTMSLPWKIMVLVIACATFPLSTSLFPTDCPPASSPQASPPSGPVSSSPSAYSGPPSSQTLASRLPHFRGSIKAGYWLSSLADKLPPSAIPTQYFSHLFYAFVSPDPSSYLLSITQPDEQWMSNFTSTLHSKDPPAKAFLCIGGGKSSPDTFSRMASNPANRSSFIKSAIWTARRYGFDGLELDWEFPGTPEDMSNLSVLFQEWRQALESDSKISGKPRLLLSAAVYFSANFFLSEVHRAYPGDSIKDYVDFVNAMCFDYHGSWDTSVTGEHALLFDNSSNISTSSGIESWKTAGVPPEKLVMGLPLYGRTWKLKDPNQNGIGAPAVGVGPGNGTMIYSDIVDYNSGNGASVVAENVTVSTYSYKGTDWIGYDGPISVAKKTEYAKNNGLGGYFFWALGYDKNWTLSSIASSTWDNQSS